MVVGGGGGGSGACAATATATATATASCFLLNELFSGYSEKWKDFLFVVVDAWIENKVKCSGGSTNAAGFGVPRGLKKPHCLPP